MGMLVSLGREYQNSEIVLYCLKIWGKIARARKNIVKAEQLFKQHKQMCDMYRSFENKISSYEHLGLCAQERLKHKTALSYFIKMLQMSWFVDNPDFELKSYDMIGMQYFYMDSHDKAHHYHNRAMLGIVEPKDSDLRKIGINRALQKLPHDALDYLSGKKNTEYWGFPAAYNDNPNNNASSDEETDIQIAAPLEETDKKTEKHNRIVQIFAHINDVKSGKTLRKVQKQINIHKIFEKDLNREPSANSSIKLPDVIPSSGFKALGVFQKISEPIYISHLSPNRGLQNFSKLNMILASEEKQIFEDFFDRRTALKAVYKLEKLIKNLECALLTLQKISSNDQKLTFEFQNVDFSSLAKQPRRSSNKKR